MIPVDGSDYNGSPLVTKVINGAEVVQTGIPTLRDFNATNLPVVDPNLIEATVTVSNIDKAGTLVLNNVVSCAGGRVSFWADPQKDNPAPDPAAVPATPNVWSETIYVEGDHESFALDDTEIQAVFTSNDGTETATSVTYVTVAPVLNSSEVTIPSQSVVFYNQNPVNGLQGLAAQTPSGTPGFTLTANVTNGPLQMTYVQDVMSTQNGFNSPNPGALFTMASGIFPQDLLPKPGSKVTYPALDSLASTLPTYPYTSVTQLEDCTSVDVIMTDSPSTGYPGNGVIAASFATKVDYKQSFQTWLVVQYPDANNTIYPIANLTWSVNFWATDNVPNSGVSVIQPASMVSLVTPLTASNDNPAQTGGPVLDGNLKWQ